MASQPIYQLYVELEEYKPKIWRRFQVQNNITMAKLGYIIMTIFEMQASHLFCFDVQVLENIRKSTGKKEWENMQSYVMELFYKNPHLRDKHIALPFDSGFDDLEEGAIDASKVKLGKILSHEKETMTFTYDYGDNWEIYICLEKIIVDKELPGKELPRVLDGVGYGIVEDCGGRTGLKEMSQAFKRGKGRVYQEYSQWLGVDTFDFVTFDIEDMNYRVKKVPRIYREIYEYDIEPTKRSMDILVRNYKNRSRER